MAAMLPMAMFGLKVPAGGIPITGPAEFDAAYRITMAAIDPDATVDYHDCDLEPGTVHRSTLKIIRVVEDEEDMYDSDEFDADDFEQQMLNGDDDDSEEDSEEGDDAAGPSDPLKSTKARKAAANAAIEKLLQKEAMDLDSEEDVELANGVNGQSSKARGKMPSELGLVDEEDEDSDDERVEEFVVCTLDPTKNWQQPLDIVVGSNDKLYFQASGTHSIYLTGNYVIPAIDDDEDDEDSDVEDYDLEPDLDELDEYDTEDELDGLDELADPRVLDLEEDDEDVPVLIEAATKKSEKKGKNKRPAEDDTDNLDDMIAGTKVKEAVNGEPKLSKKQAKKLKKADGTAAAAATPVEAVNATKAGAEAPSSANKKVQFAKELEQGPTPTKDIAKNGDKSKAGQASLGLKKVYGVTIDDKKLGTGPTAKSGDRVDMRYIGKLEKDNKVFDSNKKGKPFSFKLGVGEVIKGWDIGIQGMSVGGERRIVIPAGLAYGSKGAGGDIPPNATLIFDVKLLEIKRK